MTAEPSINLNENKQLYLQRVNQFYHFLKNGLAGKHLIFSITPYLFKDELGSYRGTQMMIEKEDKLLLAHLIPVGAKNLIGEGVIEIVNWLGNEHIFYLPKPGPTMTMPSGKTMPILKGIHQDGWYWIEDPRTQEAHKVDKELLLKLITRVSDYEFV
jgi:hypothetical protein